MLALPTLAERGFDAMACPERYRVDVWTAG